MQAVRSRGILMGAAMALSLPMALAGGAVAQASPAEVSVEVDCDSGMILIESSKDLSNIVYENGGYYSDDMEHTKIDGLSGYTYALDSEGVSTIWVKSGNNKSGDGPGYGEMFEIDTSHCDMGDDPYYVS